ncbi:DNA-binding protein [Oxalicibacterium faecigallinarum]|uniref:Integrase n=1 Tax=Oxalicibacterium faecigallinarum TaxID=573741 RepID=A0A8J3AVI8_9BURK|nr:DNA-binding protein [Oxalicibacterium faecigallinarum]GGI16983.1 integrase [Oxalicibacterium faecigallinarum]
MAKTGIYKSDVKKARDSIVAQNKHPSVDAVRIALGNTGSKSTIHKYLKELEFEHSHLPTTTDSLSESIQNLVANLANQLVIEADARVEEMSVSLREREKKLENELNAIKANNADLQNVRADLNSQVTLANQTIESLRNQLNNETLARRISDQKTSDLEELLAQSKKHVESLEEKHAHARDALEHYRESIKERRDQENRKHDSQLQQLQAEVRVLQQTISVKAEEIMHLNRESAVVLTNLSHAKNALYEEERQRRLLNEEITKLERLNQDYRFQLQDKDVKFKDLKAEFEQSIKTSAHLIEDKIALEKTLAVMQSTFEEHKKIHQDFRDLLQKNQESKKS